MSPFLTFAICLSIAYLLYYGANIGKDLYATGKQLTSNEEVFEIEDVPVETAVSVNEQGAHVIVDAVEVFTYYSSVGVGLREEVIFCKHIYRRTLITVCTCGSTQ